MQKLMMQCQMKDERLDVPECIIPMQLCKLESWFVKKKKNYKLIRCLF